jgi:hypothetical protein
MPDPVSTFVLGAVDTLSKLWEKSLTLFSAFAVICLLLLGLSTAAVIFGVGDSAVHCAYYLVADSWSSDIWRFDTGEDCRTSRQ